MRRLVVIVGLLTTASVATAEPLAILRGVVVTQHGEARAYLEDPRTGTLRAYSAGEAIGDGQIEAIREDRVILRRGTEHVELLMGTLASAPDGDAVTARPTREPVEPAVYRPNPSGGPTIGNGQSWLDRLGIPPGALSRAIEQAPTAPDGQHPDD